MSLKPLDSIREKNFIFFQDSGKTLNNAILGIDIGTGHEIAELLVK